jgi:hypothetical protein
MFTSTQSEDEEILDGSGESTTDSDESQESSVEDNSHGEAKKNDSNFKKLSKSKKQLERKLRDPAFLKAQLAKLEESSDEDSDESDEEEDSDSGEEIFSDAKSEIWFLKNPEAEEYKEKMIELVEENPRYAHFSKEDLFVLAKGKFPKSSSKKSFDVGKGKTAANYGSKRIEEYTAEEIEAMPLSVYKQIVKAQKK